MKQFRFGNKFISHANTYIAQLKSFHVDLLYFSSIPIYQLCDGIVSSYDPYILFHIKKVNYRH